MSERTIVITGASDGIGAAAARALSERGDRVVVVGRSPEKTRAVADDLGADHHLVDFAQLGQVRALADTLLAAYPRIDVLLNNAGAVMGGRQITADGFEKTMAVNHLAPFLLTQLLQDRLIESRAKVITTASAAHRFARLRLDDLDFTRGYSDMRAYGTSKLANILFSSELHRRFHRDGISTASVHPGVIASNFGRRSNPLLKLVYSWPFNLRMIDNAQGADTLVWLATTEPDLTWTSGGYYSRRTPASLSHAASDVDLARRLWDRSAALVTPFAA